MHRICTYYITNKQVKEGGTCVYELTRRDKGDTNSLHDTLETKGESRIHNPQNTRLLSVVGIVLEAQAILRGNGRLATLVGLIFVLSSIVLVRRGWRCRHPVLIREGGARGLWRIRRRDVDTIRVRRVG